MTKKELFEQSFTFEAQKYEIWEKQQCVSTGNINAQISALFKGKKIHFDISNFPEIKDLNIESSFDIEIALAHILVDRIQYADTLSTCGQFLPNRPTICNVFPNGDNKDCLRFAIKGTMPSSNIRLIEFYGRILPFKEKSQVFLKPQEHLHNENVSPNNEMLYCVDHVTEFQKAIELKKAIKNIELLYYLLTTNTSPSPINGFLLHQMIVILKTAGDILSWFYERFYHFGKVPNFDDEVDIKILDSDKYHDLSEAKEDLILIMSRWQSFCKNVTFILELEDPNVFLQTEKELVISIRDYDITIFSKLIESPS